MCNLSTKSKNPYKDMTKEEFQNMLDKFGFKYSNLNNDNIVVLPCKVNDWLYYIDSSIKCRCIGFAYLFEKEFEKDGWVIEIETENKLKQSIIGFGDIGRRWFLSKQDAKKAFDEHKIEMELRHNNK